MIKGRVWRYGDHVNTDLIIPGRYLDNYDMKSLATHAMEDIDTGFASAVRPGDVIVAGRNFGCGSSREQAPLVLRSWEWARWSRRASPGYSTATPSTSVCR